MAFGTRAICRYGAVERQGVWSAGRSEHKDPNGMGEPNGSKMERRPTRILYDAKRLADRNADRLDAAAVDDPR